MDGNIKNEVDFNATVPWETMQKKLIIDTAIKYMAEMPQEL